MEHAEHGFTKAVMSLVSGFILSIVVSSVFSSVMGNTGKTFAVLVNLFSITVGIVQLERAKYWGLFYSLGYFLGLIAIGQYLMESWEWFLYCLIIGFYISQKVVRKARTLC
ncbi:hypothetical protein DRO19_03600 [Candidatus Bathyarchaeota archaeon]|nr:MAG: hypothetical protein DRO19_03600 [Candidatus Bathyarchaeota archaeon]